MSVRVYGVNPEYSIQRLLQYAQPTRYTFSTILYTTGSGQAPYLSHTNVKSVSLRRSKQSLPKGLGVRVFMPRGLNVRAAMQCSRLKSMCTCCYASSCRSTCGCGTA